MLIKTRGIIFRAKKYSETSVIADVYTEAKGMRSYLISGVRKKNARVSPSLLQIMALVDMVVYHRDDKDLTRLKEIKAAHVFQSIPFDVRKGAVGMFMAEIARKTLRQSEEQQALFDFLFSNFQYLDQTSHSFSNLHLHFMLGLSEFLGFMPSGESTNTSPYFDLKEGVFMDIRSDHLYYLEENMSSLLSQLLNCQKEECHTIKMSREERKTLLRHLIDYYKWHIENLPDIQAHLILEEVLD